ncbi:hypothetical protein PENSTE_c011G03323 [Penicillium steckii]|uniref:N-acetyltransferase domain-containing protein n=1 Tax=Penicillium steckii TaxID=303698 RepID=A0A1V6T7U6_9EURO|nr:hypothetical protein PENSTE_c011G03323 [Penicillium steckii]
MGSIKSNLQILPATEDDIPALVDLWFKAFSIDPGMMQIFPDTPNMRKWFADYNALDFATKPYQYFIKVVDPEILDEQGFPRILAYAKWDTAMPNIRGPRFPPWDLETPGELATNVFDSLNGNRDRVMGDLKHYYLDMLCTHPDFERRGAGSMLVKWGCDLADKDGVAAYVDASKSGAPLYEKFGFVDRSLPGQGDIASMGRFQKTSS